MFDTKPTVAKMLFIPIDCLVAVEFDDPDYNDKILAQICQHDPNANKLIELSTRYEIIDIVETHDDQMEVSHLMAVVALWFKSEDAIMLKLEGNFGIV